MALVHSRGSMRPNNLVMELDERLAEKNLEGLWNEALWDSDAKIMTKDPQTAVVPYLWKSDDIIPHLERAGEIIGLDGKVERRTLRLVNPGLKNLRGQKRATTQTIHMSVQLLKPGEHATSHRHNFGAFRFIIKGPGAYTVVEGEKFVMEEGDLILNPPNAWHGHGNDAEPIIWLDGLDYPLINSLQVLTWEAFPGDYQPLKNYADYTEHRAGAARPVGQPQQLGPLAYKWKDTASSTVNATTGRRAISSVFPCSPGTGTSTPATSPPSMSRQPPARCAWGSARRCMKTNASRNTGFMPSRAKTRSVP